MTQAIRILLIDDEQGSRVLHQQLIEKTFTGIVVIPLEGPPDPLDKILGYDGLVIDERLARGESGIAVAERVKQLRWQFPILLLTGLSLAQISDPQSAIDFFAQKNSGEFGALTGVRRLIRWIAALREATSLRESLEPDVLRIDKARLRTAVELSPDAAVLVDQDGVIDFVNAAFTRLTGYSVGELIGQKIEMLVPERVRKLHHSYRGAFVKQPRTRIMGEGLDLALRCQSGSEIGVQISLGPLYTSEGLYTLASVRKKVE